MLQSFDPETDPTMETINIPSDLVSELSENEQDHIDNSDNDETMEDNDSTSPSGGHEDTIENDPSLRPPFLEKLEHYRSLLLKLGKNRRSTQLRPYTPMYNNRGVQIYCLCRKPDDGETMLQCDTCKEWYHIACIDILDNESEVVDAFVCSSCETLIESLNKTLLEDSKSKPRLEDKAKPTKEKSKTPRIILKQPPVKPLRKESTRSILAATLDAGDLTKTIPASVKKKPPPVEEELASRKLAKKNFYETLSQLFSETQETLTVENRSAVDMGYTLDLDDPKSYAEKLETELFNTWAQPNAKGKLDCLEKYKSKYRSIQFNLKDKSNIRLKTKLFKQEITPSQLVHMTPEEMANDSVTLMAQQVRQQAIKETLKVKEEPNTKQQIELLYPQGYDPTQFVKMNETDKPLLGSVNKSEEIKEEHRPRFDLDQILANIDKKQNKDEQKEYVRLSDKPESPIKKRRISDVSKDVKDIEMTNKSDTEILVKTTNDIVDVKSNEIEMNFNQIDESKQNSESNQTIESNTINLISQPVALHTFTYPIPETNEIVWKGYLGMPQVGGFNGTCIQKGGKTLEEKRIWENLLSTELVIDGRIDTGPVLIYLDQLSSSTSKQIAVIEFYPNAGTQSEFEQLFYYFHQRSKYGVIKVAYKTMKDFYVIPVGPNEPLPPTLQSILPDTSLIDRPRLFGAIIMVKDGIKRFQLGPQHTKTETKHRTVPQRSEPPPLVVEQPKPVEVPSLAALQNLINQIQAPQYYNK